MRGLAITINLHHALFLKNVRDRQGVRVLVHFEIDRDDLAANNMRRIPAKHKCQHLAEGGTLFWSRAFIKVSGALYFAGVVVNQVSDHNRLKS